MGATISRKRTRERGTKGVRGEEQGRVRRVARGCARHSAPSSSTCADQSGDEDEGKGYERGDERTGTEEYGVVTPISELLPRQHDPSADEDEGKGYERGDERTGTEEYGVVAPIRVLHHLQCAASACSNMRRNRAPTAAAEGRAPPRPAPSHVLLHARLHAPEVSVLGGEEDPRLAVLLTESRILGRVHDVLDRLADEAAPARHQNHRLCGHTQREGQRGTQRGTQIGREEEGRKGGHAGLERIPSVEHAIPRTISEDLLK